MHEKAAINSSAYYYSLNMLRLLLGMRLITEEEYERVAHISADHYGVELYCV